MTTVGLSDINRGFVIRWMRGATVRFNTAGGFNSVSIEISCEDFSTIWGKERCIKVAILALGFLHETIK